jgi:hypothetical protein
MTTVISRLYADEATAHSVAATLSTNGIAHAMIDLIPPSKADTRTRIETIASTRVLEADAEIYAKAMQPGNMLLVVRAEFNPRGAALRARAIVDQAPSIPLAVTHPNRYIREAPRAKHFLSVMQSHPLFLTARDRQKPSDQVRVADRTASRTSGSKGWLTSRWILPFPLLAGHKERISVIPGGKRMIFRRERLP